jgi:hypothetical protein
MKRVETSHHIKSLHYLLNAHFDLRNHRGFEKSLKKLKELAETERVKDHDNFRIQAFIYLSQARINRHFMRGSFKEGLSIVPAIEKELRIMTCFSTATRCWYSITNLPCCISAAGIITPVLITCKRSSMIKPTCAMTCSAMPGCCT